MRNRIQLFRWKKGWSQQQLANKSGVSKSVISSLENQRTLHPTIDVAYKLSKALEVYVFDIFYEEEEKEM